MNDWVNAIKSGVATLGYNLGAGGMGITEPYGTPYSTNQSPQGVYNATQGYTQPYTPAANKGYTAVNTSGNSNTGGSVPVGGNKPTGQVLGIGTGPDTGPSAPSQPSYADIQTANINNKYNDYFNTLDQMMNSNLPAQQAAQQSQIQGVLNTNMSNLDLQKQQSLGDLTGQETKVQGNQVKTLKDISNNIRNLMQGANNYLGAMGAGDSSAVNQYAYALSKLGSQQYGNVKNQTAQAMQDIGDQKSKLNNIYMQESNTIKGNADQQMSSLSQWFATQQQNILGLKAQGQLNKGTDLQQLTDNLLQQAMQAANDIKNQVAQKQATLDSWAATQSSSIGELTKNLAAVQYTAQNPTYSLAGATPTQAPTGQSNAAYGGYASGGAYDDYLKSLGLK